MKSFRRSTTPPEQRQVRQAGRTTAFSYYSSRSGDSASLGRRMLRQALDTRHAKRAARYWTQRFGAGLVIIALVVAAANSLWLSADPRVLPVDTNQASFLHSMSTYEQAAGNLVAASFWNRNKITVDTEAISSGLKRQFPELSVVSVNLPLIGHRPVVYVAAAEPALALTTNDGSTYIIDSDGLAIGTANAARIANLHLIPVRDQSGTAVRLDQLTLSDSVVTFIRTVLYQINQKHLSLATFVLPAGTSELDMYLNGPHYFVKFNLANDTAAQQVGTFLAVKHSLEGKGVTPSQYIDVRVDGRAYYL